MMGRIDSKYAAPVLLAAFVAYVFLDPFSDFSSAFHRHIGSVRLGVFVAAGLLSCLVFAFRGRRFAYLLFPVLSIGFGYFGVLVAWGEFDRGIVPILYAAFVWAGLVTKAWAVACVFFLASYLFGFSPNSGSSLKSKGKT